MIACAYPGGGMIDKLMQMVQQVQQQQEGGECGQSQGGQGGQHSPVEMFEHALQQAMQAQG